MHKRLLAITFLGGALLFSQGGSFLIAALCPHLRSGQVSCNKHSSESTMSEMSDDEMGHMAMDSMDESASTRDPNAVALGEPIGLCSHCAMHSRTVPPAVSLREIEASKRSGTFVTPDVLPQVVSVEMRYLAIFTSRAHGPPGETTPRHILINIFRI
jgi:hypothetical protein